MKKLFFALTCLFCAAGQAQHISVGAIGFTEVSYSPSKEREEGEKWGKLEPHITAYPFLGFGLGKWESFFIFNPLNSDLKIFQALKLPEEYDVYAVYHNSKKHHYDYFGLGLEKNIVIKKLCFGKNEFHIFPFMELGIEFPGNHHSPQPQGYVGVTYVFQRIWKRGEKDHH